jgi:four helix bundle protein
LKIIKAKNKLYAMGKFNSFEEIISWKKSREFNLKIYRVTENQYFKKDFDLTRQIRRASISISSNIAEGFERNTDKEFIYFLYVAKASAGEVRSQIYLALDLNYISIEISENLLNDITEISKLLGGFIKYLEINKK